MKKSTAVEDRYGPVVLECVSKSEPNRDPYRVRCKEGAYSCNCKGWIFNREKSKRCKHTDEARRMRLGEVEFEQQVYSGTVSMQVEFRSAPVVIDRLRPYRELVERLLKVLPKHLQSELTKYMSQMAQVLEDAGALAVMPEPVQVTSMRRIVFDD